MSAFLAARPGWVNSELFGEGDDSEFLDEDAGRRRVNVGDPLVCVGHIRHLERILT